MKVLVGFLRIFVGILFIISGLIKLNDPVGFSFKLGDYFAPDVLNLEFLVPYALLIAVVVVIYEVLLGVMLIIGYAKKFTLWSLLIMIVGFTFLTFYSAYFNKVTDCGCFGDALPLVPWESFIKDVVLLVMIIILFIGRKHIWPFFTKMSRTIIVFVSFVLCLFLGYHVLMHLPVKDFRAYAVGKNIKEGMSVPDDAPKAIFDYHWKFEVDGKEQIITTRGSYPNVDGKLIDSETVKVQEGYEPPIHDFSMERDGEDHTDTLLDEPNLLVVIAYSLDITEHPGYIAIKEATDKAIANNYKVIGMSASSQEETEKLKERHGLNFDFYFCDMTTLKTIVRSNPGLVMLENGTITQKLHFNDAADLKLVELTGSKTGIDERLKKQLDSIMVLDQKYRQQMNVSNPASQKVLLEQMGLSDMSYKDALWQKQNVIDSSNMAFVAKVFDTKGYPGVSMVGEETSQSAWFVLQHNSDRIGEYLPMIKEAAKKDELSFTAVAMMEDRYLMGHNKPQVYGTQGMTNEIVGKIIWPIEDPENVNARRVEAGYDTTVEEYAKRLYGDDFEYRVVTLEELNLN